MRMQYRTPYYARSKRVLKQQQAAQAQRLFDIQSEFRKQLGRSLSKAEIQAINRNAITRRGYNRMENLLERLATGEIDAAQLFYVLEAIA